MGEFHVGQSVIVREWEDMAAEYGTTNGGTAIRAGITAFVDGMRYLCGEVFTIRRVYDSGRVLLNEDSSWTFTTDMFRPFETEIDDPFQDERVSGVVTEYMIGNAAT